MNYKEKMDAVQIDKINSPIDRNTGKVNDFFVAGHRHARHQCAEIAAYADGEIERLGKKIADREVLQKRIEELNATISKLSRENEHLEIQLDLHREIRKLRAGK